MEFKSARMPALLNWRCRGNCLHPGVGRSPGKRARLGGPERFARPALHIEATKELRPREGLDSPPVSGLVLKRGDVDAIAGLLHLRERRNFSLCAISGFSR